MGASYPGMTGPASDDAVIERGGDRQMAVWQGTGEVPHTLSTATGWPARLDANPNDEGGMSD